MDWQTIAGLVARHLLTSAGGWLVGLGLLDKDTGVTTFVGAGMVLFGIAWSAWQKYGQALLVAHLRRTRELIGE